MLRFFRILPPLSENVENLTLEQLKEWERRISELLKEKNDDSSHPDLWDYDG